VTPPTLKDQFDGLFLAVERLANIPRQEPITHELGTVLSVKDGIATVSGLKNLGLEDLVVFKHGELGIALTLDESQIGVVLLDPGTNISAGSAVKPCRGPLRVPVGAALAGRILDGAGRPIDAGGPLQSGETRDAESPAPPIMDRAPVNKPLQTGIKVIDALIPLGKGQRELIVGERQTGKTSIALDAIINQVDKGVVCVYCAIGQRDSAVTRVISDLERTGALENTCIVVARAEDPPGLQFIAPYTATAIAESFMLRGQDALIVYDDLAAHAVAYRELSLLLRRPPGREAFPGDVFYLHSRLLERSTHLKPELGGGSLTALPICALDSDSLTSYIPTNLISITDGQLVLSSKLFQKGQLPAVDIGMSVSRVGSHAQLPAYREFLADLRLEYAQFEELEAFARFDTRLSPQTLATLERGKRIRAVFSQPRYELLSAAEQVAIFRSALSGHLDTIEPSQVAQWQSHLLQLLAERGSALIEAVNAGSRLSDDHETLLLELTTQALDQVEASVAGTSASKK
jgi:F-type H+/Na+-transporting ATPase subunit alpha